MGEEKKPRDFWDKLTIFFSLFTPLLMGVIGLHLNAQQNAINELLKKQELQINAANSIEKFFLHLKKDADPSLQLAALSVIYSIGFKDEAVHIAIFNQSNASVRFLENIPAGDAANKKQSIDHLKKITMAAETQVQKEAQKALQKIVSTGDQTAVRQADQALKDINLASKSPWGIVTGFDRTPDGARDEVKRAQRAGFEAQVYFRQNIYRTVIHFPNKEAAQAKLPDVRGQIRADAYPVQIETWCPGAAWNEQDKYYTCGE